MEAWLVAIAALIAFVVVGVIAIRERRTLAAVRRAAGIASVRDPVRVVSTLIERIEYLEAAAAADARDREAFSESLSQGVLTVGEGGRIVAANGAAHALLDRAPGTLLGRQRETPSSSRSRITASGSRAARRRAFSSASTRLIGRESGARPVERALGSQLRATSSSSTANGSGSAPLRATAARSRSRSRSRPRPWALPRPQAPSHNASDRPPPRSPMDRLHVATLNILNLADRWFEPSGLQTPAMDTDGEPECLDYIWLRGAVRVDSARPVFDRPDALDPTLYASDHLGISAHLEIG